MDAAQGILFLSKCLLVFLLFLYVVALLVVLRDLLTFAFVGDLTKSMGVSLDGEISVPPGVDLARVGLGAPLKAPLLSGAANPSGDSGVGAEGLFGLFMFVFSICLRC